MRIIVFILTILLAFSVSLFAEQFQIDPNANCLFLNKSEIFQGKSVKVKLSMNTRYRVSLSGEAFYSNQTGAGADPMPGVVIFYPTNEQDGFASIYRVIKPGETIYFTTPDEDDQNVFLVAYVMDYWHESPNAGKFFLTVEKE